MLSAQAVSKRIGIGRNAVTELARVGALKGEKIGLSWAFEDRAVARFCKAVGLNEVQKTNNA